MVTVCFSQFYLCRISVFMMVQINHEINFFRVTSCVLLCLVRSCSALIYSSFVLALSGSYLTFRNQDSFLRMFGPHPRDTRRKYAGILRCNISESPQQHIFQTKQSSHTRKTYCAICDRLLPWPLLCNRYVIDHGRWVPVRIQVVLSLLEWPRRRQELVPQSSKVSRIGS